MIFYTEDYMIDCRREAINEFKIDINSFLIVIIIDIGSSLIYLYLNKRLKYNNLIYSIHT